MLDNFYISVFNHYKTSFGKRSLLIALIYINVLELSLILAIAAFFMAFANQMRMIVMTSTKFWILFCLVSAFVLFKNWMRYNGKKRHVLNAKRSSKSTPIYLLWFLPVGFLLLAFVLLQGQ